MGADIQAKEKLSGIRALCQQIRRSIQPQPTHCGPEPIAGTGAIVMNDISCVLEIQPVIVAENITPWARASDEDLKTAHFLHAVDFPVGEFDAWVLGLEASGYCWEIG